jgi:hypothetical protein
MECSRKTYTENQLQPKMKTTDTPRTDAAREPYYDGKTSDWVHYTICRMIERELAASKAEVERLRKEIAFREQSTK